MFGKLVDEGVRQVGQGPPRDRLIEADQKSLHALWGRSCCQQRATNFEPLGASRDGKTSHDAWQKVFLNERTRAELGLLHQGDHCSRMRLSHGFNRPPEQER